MKGLLIGNILLQAVLAASAVYTELPPLTASNYRVVKSCDYSSVAAAVSDWAPMKGSPPATLATAGDRVAVEMRCTFKGTTVERVSWDTAVRFDASACQGLRLRFSCADTAPVAQFSLYLRSGDGWYSAPFAGTETPGWTTVAIDKAEMRIEGKPAGWSKIDGIRISAWRGSAADTSFCVADIGVFGEDASVAVIRADSVAASGGEEAVSITRYTANVTQYFNSLDIPYRVVSDADITANGLNGMELVVLPYNPDMPEPVQREVIRFIRGGGGLVCFFALPARILEAAGMAPGRHMEQEYKGQLDSMRFTANGALPGAPAAVTQHSWGICRAAPVEGRSRVAAHWYDESGKNTGLPAVLVSDRCVWITNILLSGDPANKQRLLLAAAGRFMPRLWQAAAGQGIERIGRLAAYRDAASAEKSILAAGSSNAEVREALERMGVLRRQAGELADKGRFIDAVVAAEQAQDMMLRAYCGVQVPRADEFRAFWCHSPFGIPGMSWDEAIRTLADNGFNAIMPNMLWGGVAYYRSRVLPVAPEVEEKGDQLAECLAACRKYGVQCHVWKVCWNMGTRDVDGFQGRMKAQGRTQVGFSGKTMDAWLCPSHAGNRKLEFESMVEVATNYGVDGVHFDYIRYPGEDYCFCGSCRALFEQRIGGKVADWPAAVRNDGRLAEEWSVFRRENITGLMADISGRLRWATPNIKISAAVFPNLTLARTGIGQDWGDWCRKGYVDFVCPMNYKPDDTWFENMTARQQEWAGSAGCYPGIGLSTWQPGGRICRLVGQINVSRRLNTGGFCIFKYDESQARDTVPLCGLGITRRESPLIPADQH